MEWFPECTVRWKKQNAKEYTPRMLYFEWEEEIRKHTHTPAYLDIYVYKNKHIKNKTEDKVD